MKRLECLQSDLSSVLKELSSLNSYLSPDCVKDTFRLGNIKVTQIAQDQYWLNSMGGDYCQNNPPYEMIYLAHFITGLQVNFLLSYL